MTYVPKPIDTSHVVVPERLLNAIEGIAENTHEVWSQGRIAEGWSYGPQRDEAKREHPSLVPYAKLPEAEKQIDRATALQAIKVALALGFRIECPA